MEQEKRAIALGFFDGVHLGHGALLRRVGEIAGRSGLIPCAVTFDRHPKELLPGGGRVTLLNTQEEREALMRELYGIREVIVLPFDAHMRDMDWRDFVTEILIKEHGAAYLVAGHDYRFGRGGAGNAERLRSLCGELGLGCDIIRQVELDGAAVSSTRIRSLISQGETERAVRLLGHPHVLSGPVVHGRRLGRTLGVPTCNIVPAEGIQMPAYGAYISKVLVDSVRHMAVTNIGVRPTVGDGGGPVAESWLLEHDEDLYGRTVRVELYKRLRGERRFASMEALRADIIRCAEEARRYFAQ